MRIGIIARQAEVYSTRRLTETAERRGHSPVVVDPLHWAPGVGVTVRDAEALDVAIPRIATLVLEHSLSVIRDLELRGVPVLNTAASMALAGNKFASLQLLHAAGLRVPRSCMPRRGEALREFVEQIGGPPVILKSPRGFGGSKVMRADSADTAEALLNVFLDLNECVIVQEFWGRDPRDVRVLVIDGEPVAAVARQAPIGDFRANVHVGGSCRAHDASAEELEAATQAALVSGLSIAGIDLLISEEGVVVTEVNAAPGLKGLEEATGVDAAERIILAAERRVS